jgi:dTDP-glucose pyrophosphorylase
MIVLVPMAGRGSRYSRSGYSTPKPFIDVCGVPMFIRALQSIAGVAYTQLVFVTLREHNTKYNIQETLNSYGYSAAQLVSIDEVTEGQLCTVMAARRFFENGEEVLIIASDSYIASGIQQDLAAKPNDCTGIISVINLSGEQWSFARTDGNGNVVEVAEKNRISDHASTGIYYFADGRELCAIADAIIADDERTRGEFYVIPVYQKLINQGKKVTISFATEMWDMGTPESKKLFEDFLISKGYVFNGKELQ